MRSKFNVVLLYILNVKVVEVCILLVELYSLSLFFLFLFLYTFSLTNQKFEFLTSSCEIKKLCKLQ